MTVTKADIVRAIAGRIGYEKKRSAKLIEMLLEIIKGRLESGEDVLISGFGKFCVKEKMERRVRNPATGKSITLAPRRVVTFRSSRNLRNKINH